MIKIGAFKAGLMENAFFFASLGNRKQCKIQHCFCSQNVRGVFLYKAISLFIIYLDHACLIDRQSQLWI